MTTNNSEELENLIKQSTKELRESEEKWHLLVQNIPDIIFTIDKEGTFLSFNRPVTPGLTEEDVVGKKIYEFMTPENEKRMRKQYAQAFETGESYDYEEFGPGPEGQNTRCYRTRLVPIKKNDHTIALMQISTDITEHKKAEQDLRESEQRFRIISENSNEVIFTMGMDLKFTHVSPSSYSLLGYTPEEIMNVNFEKFNTPASIKTIMDAFKEELKKERKKDSDKARVRAIEVEQIHKNGAIINVEMVVTFLRDEDGKAIGILGVSRNITERKQAEIKLRESEEKLKQLNLELEQRVEERTSELKKSEKNFKDIIENIHDSIIISGLDGKLKYISPQYAKLIGRELTVGEAFGKTMHPDDLKRVTTLFAKALKQGTAIESGEVEYRVKHKDGHYIWIATTTSNHYDEDGTLIGFLTTARDVTARKSAEQKLQESLMELKETEQKLRESEKKYRYLLDNIADVILEIDMNYTITYISPQVSDVIGYSVEEIIDAQSFLYVHPDDLNITEEAIKTTIQTGEVDVEFRMLHKDGHYVSVAAKGKRVDVDGKIKLVSVIRDITKRKEAEKKLRQSEERLRLISENANDVIWTADMNLNLTYVSPSTQNLSGWSVEEIMSMAIDEFHTPNSYKILVENFKKEMNLERKKKKNLNRSRVFEVEQIHKDGSIIDVEIVVTFLRDENQKAIGLVGVTRDITERKKAEEALKKSEKKYRKAYKQANFYKDLFVHDISNIFNALYGYSQLYSEYKEETERVYDPDEMMKNMSRHVLRGVNLIYNVQKLSKIDRIIIPTEDINVCEVIKESIENTRKSFPKRDIKINFESNNQDFSIQANELLLDVFDNILNNAVKYNKNSPVEVLIKLNKVQDENKGYVKIEFLDNGIGIMDELKQYTFKKGYKTEMKSKGMGFGLSIVKKILKSYNGKIWVENKVEGDYSQGSNFILLIPQSS
jgi:PAS domain S-box-containing protein